MYIPREAEVKLRDFLKTNKVIILLGSRQVGKTTLIKHFFGEEKATIFNLDIEVDKNRLLAAATLYPKEAMNVLGNPGVLIIDEAQRLPETGRIVKGWYDTMVPNKVILLGSSSLNLLDQSVESLTGRNLKLYLPPLTFSEILHWQKWYSSSFNRKILKEKFHQQLKSMLLQQIVYGNYPEAVITNKKEEYLLNLAFDYLLKDVFQLGMVKSPEILRKLLSLLAYQVGSEVSILELANNLQVARQTVERYLELLERTFVIFRLPAFSGNLRKEISKSNKIFFWDTGVRNAVLKEFSLSEYRSDIGSLWENWIIAEFAKKNLLSGQPANLYFWRKQTGGEVDLIVKKGEKMHAFEIKWSSGRKISKSGFAKKYGVKVSLINKENFIDYLLD